MPSIITIYINDMLNKEQKKYLRTLAHDLNTIIWIGQQGITASLMAEINTALDHHELIKLKIHAGDRRLREQAAQEICRQAGAEPVQKIVSVMVLYRRNREDPKISLPE